MKELFGLKEKTYNYLTDDGSGDKKAKGTNLKSIKIVSTQLNFIIK